MALSGLCQWFQVVFFSSVIGRQAEIGKNFRIAHPIGIVIGQARIGNDVTIWQNVAIGATGTDEGVKQYPAIGNHVKLYAGAIVIGGITVGSGATVGALSLVKNDVPAQALAVGIPARNILKR